MKNLKKIAESIHILGSFCGKRDITELTPEALQKAYGIKKADLLILFGGSIPYGCDVAGAAMLAGMASRLMIVGGEGHTTEALRQNIHNAYPTIPTKGKMEAEVMSAYIQMKYGIKDCLLECESTNCGNNVTNTLQVLEDNQIAYEHMIIMQDATMQNRMDAGFRKFLKNKCVQIINFASYQVEVTVADNELVYAEKGNEIWGMWDINHYITLLMGEIPRLYDGAGGYGPEGKDFIAHVEVPEKVLEAYQYLREEYGDFTREANPLYASKKEKNAKKEKIEE